MSRKAIFIFPLCWCVSGVQTVRENFWIYDDVTDNGFLGLPREISIRLAREISIHNAFGPLLFLSLLSIPWDHTLFVKEHQRNTWKKRKMACICNTEKNLPRVKSTVMFFKLSLNAETDAFIWSPWLKRKIIDCSQSSKICSHDRRVLFINVLFHVYYYNKAKSIGRYTEDFVI